MKIDRKKEKRQIRNMIYFLTVIKKIRIGLLLQEDLQKDPYQMKNTIEIEIEKNKARKVVFVKIEVAASDQAGRDPDLTSQKKKEFMDKKLKPIDL